MSELEFNPKKQVISWEKVHIKGGLLSRVYLFLSSATFLSLLTSCVESTGLYSAYKHKITYSFIIPGLCDTCLNVDCQKPHSDFLLFQQELRCSFWGSTITFHVFYVEMSNLIFFWNKCIGIGGISHICRLKMFGIHGHFQHRMTFFVRDLNFVGFCHLFPYRLPAVLKQVITEFWTAKVSSLYPLSYCFSVCHHWLCII